MKLNRIILVLILLVLNHFVVSMEKTKHGKHSLNYSIKKRHKSKLGKSKSHSHSKNKMITENSFSSQTETFTQAKARLINFIMAGLSIIMSITGALLVHYTKVTNLKTLDLMKQEYKQNKDYMERIKQTEISACSTIRLMRVTNKFLFRANEYRTLYLDLFIRMKVGSDLDCKGKEGMQEVECKTLKSLQVLKNDIKQKSPIILKEIKRMEQNNCNQKSKYDPIAKENEKLAQDIQELEKKIHEEEENLFFGLLGSTVSAIGIASKKDNELFNLNTWIIPQNNKFDPSKISNLGVMVGKVGWTGFKGIDIKKKYSELQNVNSTDEKWKKKIALVVSFLNFLSTAAGTLGNVVNFTGMIGKFINVAAKFLEFFVACVDYYKAAHSDAGRAELSRAKNEFYKRLVNLGVSILELAFSAFTGAISEGLHLVRKTVALIEAKSLLRNQIKRNSYYKSYGVVQSNAAEELKTYSVCKASFINLQNFYEIFNEIATTEASVFKKYKNNKMEAIWNEVINSDTSIQEAKAKLGERMTEMCQENVQFCSRNFERAHLEELIGKDKADGKKKVEVLMNKALYGPLTDVIVTTSKDEFISFVQMGYEPIYNSKENYILGCRMCSNRRVIRFFAQGTDHVSENGSDVNVVTNFEGNCSKAEQRPCGKIFNEDKCAETTSYKSIRYEADKVLVYERVELKEYTPSLVKVFAMDPGRKFGLFPRYSIWDNTHAKWLSCGDVQSNPSIKAFCSECTNPTLIYNDLHIKITEDKKVGFSKSEFKEGEINPILQSVPFERRLSTHSGGELHYKHDRLFFLAYKTDSSYNDFVDIHEDVVNPYQGFYEVASKFNMKDTFDTGSYSSPNFVLKPNTYNWIINDNQYTSLSNIGKDLRKFISTKNKIAQKIYIHRTEDTDVADVMSSGGVTSVVFSYSLIQFEPFSPNSKVDFGQEKEDSKALCENICNPTEESLQEKLTCNFIDDLSFNQSVLGRNILNFRDRTEIEKNFKKQEQVIKFERDIRTLFKSPFYIRDPVSFTDLQNFGDDEELYLYPGRVRLRKGSSGQICFVKQFEKEVIKSLTVKACEEEDFRPFDFGMTAEEAKQVVKKKQGKHVFNIKAKDISQDIYIFFIKNTKDAKKYLGNLVTMLNGFYLVDKISGKFVDSNHSVLIYIKPLPSSGFVPFTDSYTRSFGHADSGCRTAFFSSLNEHFCFLKDRSSVCVVPDHENLVDSSIENYHENLFKISNVKENETKKIIYTYSLTDIFKSDLVGKSLQCATGDLFMPVKFHKKEGSKLVSYSNESSENFTEKEHLYRAIEISDNIIKENFVPAGPGIRSVYWLQFTFATQPDGTNTDIASKHGYIPLYVMEDIELFKLKMKVTVWVAYDYRMNLRRSDICNLCKKSQEEDEFDEEEFDENIQVNSVPK